SLDGRYNELAFGAVFTLLRGARETIHLTCPYLTAPFTSELAAAARRGLRVVVVTPEPNNWSVAQHYVRAQARRAGSERGARPAGMNHLKAILVDGRHLVMGSANFDLWSYGFQQEYLAIIDDPDVVADYRRRVLEPDLQASVAIDVSR